MPYKKPMVNPDWLPVSKVAALLGCDPTTAKDLIRTGRLNVRVVQFDSFIRINREDFERELDKRVAAGLSA
ncbi:helix-turn-helix domain-containing protein [Streptomyces sp. NPDC047939]|uniref:helix-turn-helix domain-containing protein n=1 Tax=Streptomyces sp. NPDC047939 TaxID=3155381 RepID=UPI00341248FD